MWKLLTSLARPVGKAEECTEGPSTGAKADVEELECPEERLRARRE
jgi:hypothetical protein